MKKHILIAQGNGKAIYGDADLNTKEAMEIIAEQERTEGLSEFSRKKHEENQAFLGRLLMVEQKNYKDADKIVQEVLKGIKDAEADKKLVGDFRETNLDWAYSKRFMAREYFSNLISLSTNLYTRTYLANIVRKLQK